MKYALIMSAAALAVVGVATGQEDAPKPNTAGAVQSEDEAVIAEEQAEYIFLWHERYDPITVTGLRPVEADEYTGSVTLMDPEQLEVRGSINAVDQLRAVPGVAVSRSGSAGGLTQVRLRGAEANHTLVLLYDIEISDPLTGETDFGLLNGIAPSRIEVARGEQSSLYGSDAIGGVISIGPDFPYTTNAAAELGSFGTHSVRFGTGYDTGDYGIRLSVSDFSTDGVDTSGRKGEKDGSLSRGGLLDGYVWLDNSNVGIGGFVAYQNNEADTDADTDFDGLLNDVDRATESDQWIIGVQLIADFDAFSNEFSVSYNSVERENFGDGANLNTSKGERTKVTYSPSYELDLDGSDVVLSGLVDWEQEDYTARDTQFGGFTNQEQRFETLGIAGEARLERGDLVLSTSVRHDDNDGRFDDATTGRIGASYYTNLGRFRASIGTGVKNPTFTELFGFFPGIFVGNPDLVPEKSTSWEIGWGKDFGDLQLNTTYFEAKLEDEIFTAFNPDFTSTVRNRDGKSERAGVEFGLAWQATDALNINGQATLIDSRADDGSDEIRVPGETASLSFDYHPDRWGGGRFGLAFDYVGQQDDFDFGAFPARRVELDPYVLTSATAEIPLRDRLSLTLRGENLFDENTVDVFGYESPGLGIFVGLKLRGE